MTQSAEISFEHRVSGTRVVGEEVQERRRTRARAGTTGTDARLRALTQFLQHLQVVRFLHADPVFEFVGPEIGQRAFAGDAGWSGLCYRCCRGNRRPQRRCVAHLLQHGLDEVSSSL